MVAAGVFRVLVGDVLVADTTAYVLKTFILVNLGFFVFNMIPFPPLDGSRVLFAVAPEPVQKVMATIESYGLLGFVVFFFFLFKYISPMISDIINALFRILIGA